MKPKVIPAPSVSLPLDVQKILRSLGENIRLSRKRRDMTQNDLAKAMSSTRQTISKIERGDGSVAWETFIMAVFCLSREKELDKLLDPNADRTGLIIDSRKQEKRRRVRHRRLDDLDF